MGCDIHLFVEQFRGNKWVARQPPNHGWKRQPYEWPVDRNYHMFSFLADVRSYPGSPQPLAEARGMPVDCSKVVVREVQRWAGDGHNHSHFTLEELRACDRISDDYLPDLTQLIYDLGGLGKLPVRIVFWFDN